MAANTAEGRYIYDLTRQLSSRPQTGEDSAQASAPDYLVKAAEAIARRDRIPLERAYAVIGRERPELAKRYRAERT